MDVGYANEVARKKRKQEHRKFLIELQEFLFKVCKLDAKKVGQILSRIDKQYGGK